MAKNESETFTVVESDGGRSTRLVRVVSVDDGETFTAWCVNGTDDHGRPFEFTFDYTDAEIRARRLYRAITRRIA